MRKTHIAGGLLGGFLLLLHFPGGLPEYETCSLKAETT